ncbi:hypothetical protein [Actinokineospora sp. NBRC 105648]|uniref:hypothetical protein n=1 Tax=Actinokineospora sp. NBRC 105648 TaxID=3032206 RepID=UPI0024A5C3F7|nr:hypothetical protein [Actinokineospora sp. NBRC 105648]GLZ42254.1 hypothetical protein Acsp05_58780 [Actinokineospora sp. NBRC 105648]
MRVVVLHDATGYCLLTGIGRAPIKRRLQMSANPTSRAVSIRSMLLLMILGGGTTQPTRDDRADSRGRTVHALRRLARHHRAAARTSSQVVEARTTMKDNRCREELDL